MKHYLYAEWPSRMRAGIVQDLLELPSDRDLLTKCSCISTLEPSSKVYTVSWISDPFNYSIRDVAMEKQFGSGLNTQMKESRDCGLSVRYQSNRSAPSRVPMLPVHRTTWQLLMEQTHTSSVTISPAQRLQLFLRHVPIQQVSAHLDLGSESNDKSSLAILKSVKKAQDISVVSKLRSK